MVRDIVRRNPELLDCKTNNGQTPLHLAAQNHAWNAVKTLLSRGADIDAKDDEHQTPLFKAANHQKPQTHDENIAMEKTLHTLFHPPQNRQGETSLPASLQVRTNNGVTPFRALYNPRTGNRR